MIVYFERHREPRTEGWRDLNMSLALVVALAAGAALGSQDCIHDPAHFARLQKHHSDGQLRNLARWIGADLEPAISGYYSCRRRALVAEQLSAVIPFVQSSLHYGLNADMIVSPAGRFETWLTIYGVAVGCCRSRVDVWQIALERVLEVRMRRYQAARDALAEEWELGAPESERDPT